MKRRRYFHMSEDGFIYSDRSLVRTLSHVVSQPGPIRGLAFALPLSALLWWGIIAAVIRCFR